jgi:hypothetical protein
MQLGSPVNRKFKLQDSDEVHYTTSGFVSIPDKELKYVFETGHVEINGDDM